MRKTIMLSFSLILIAATVMIGQALTRTYFGTDGVWEHGTTGWLGDGEVVSEFTRIGATRSKATVKNAKNVVVTSGWTTATISKARATAYLMQTDYAYYDYE